jgi:probable dihydroxyacetone kinase regulator
MCQVDSPCAIKTKKKLAGALKELMKTTTFDKITVSDITEKCDVHRQTFYYHFQDRYELLDWIFKNEIIDPFITDFSFENMYDKFNNLFETMLSSKKFYQNALKTNGDDLTRYISRIASEQFKNIIAIISKEAKKYNAIKDDNMLLGEFFGYGITGVVINWAIKGMKETPKQMTDRIENLVENFKRLFDN